jgi:hypothetical protein
MLDFKGRAAGLKPSASPIQGRASVVGVGPAAALD